MEHSVSAIALELPIPLQGSAGTSVCYRVLIYTGKDLSSVQGRCRAVNRTP